MNTLIAHNHKKMTRTAARLRTIERANSGTYGVECPSRSAGMICGGPPPAAGLADRVTLMAELLKGAVSHEQ